MKANLLEQGQFQQNENKEGVVIDLVDVTYAVMGANKKPKRLLKNVSLTFRAGTMCALMGPSGAGKRYEVYFIMNAFYYMHILI
jgi:ABC-type multidrug transport system fused ATPase/permease subunit